MGLIFGAEGRSIWGESTTEVAGRIKAGIPSLGGGAATANTAEASREAPRRPVSSMGPVVPSRVLYILLKM